MHHPAFGHGLDGEMIPEALLPEPAEKVIVKHGLSAALFLIAQALDFRVTEEGFLNPVRKPFQARIDAVCGNTAGPWSVHTYPYKARLRQSFAGWHS
jgi:hypothetical protein